MSCNPLPCTLACILTFKVALHHATLLVIQRLEYVVACLQMDGTCADALHGDIGIVGRDDLVVMVSKSGATEELLRLVPYVKASQQHICFTPACDRPHCHSSVSFYRQHSPGKDVLPYLTLHTRYCEAYCRLPRE